MHLGAEVKAGECRLGGAVLYHVRCDGVPCLSVVGACDALEVQGLVAYGQQLTHLRCVIRSALAWC